MLIILSSNATFDKVVKIQKWADGTQYRLLIYCIRQETPDGLLLHNTLSREMVLLNEQEREHMLDNAYLRDHWFVVPMGFDDRKFVRQVRQMHQLVAPKPSAINGFTIFTTMDCNARCFYCYELGRARTPMSQETALKVASYIAGNYQKLFAKNPNASVKITWFGGEPLYNASVIDTICNELHGQGVRFSSRMISNAYLFDTQTARKAASQWNLKLVQITLDGTEQVYNKAKAFIYKEGSAFQRVIDNIEGILDAGIKVQVRMNIDMHNADNLLELVDYLAERFAGREGLTCYSHPLFEVAGERAHTRTDERRAMVYQRQLELQERIRERGLGGKPRLSRSVKVNQCMADSGHSVTILPTGHIGLCEHYSESDYISHVDNPSAVDRDMVRSFRETHDDLDICADCAYYPQCIRLRKCEEESVCFPEIREGRLRKVRLAMLGTYQKWKAGQAQPDAEGDEQEADLENC